MNRLQEVCQSEDDTPANVLAQLTAGRRVIQSPVRWTIGAAARDPCGTPVPPEAKQAFCFCSIGALQRASPTSLHMGAIRYLSAIAAELCGEHGATNYNDHHTHAEVLAWWDLTIERAKADIKLLKQIEGGPA